MTSITFGIGRSGTGTRLAQWRSSIDNYTAEISTYTTINVALASSAGVLTNPDTNSSWTGNVLDLTGASFQSLTTPVTFRLYLYGAEATAGTAGVQGNLTFAGTTESASSPTITGAATATAFTTTYGTASAAQTFPVSGSDLTAAITATAPAGFEVSSDGTIYGPTATFPQTGGSASGTLSLRLAANAPVLGTYNAQNIALTSTGATTVNIATAASGNSVTAKSLTITANNVTKAFGATLTSGSGSTAFTSDGLAGTETIGSVTVTYGTGASAGDAAGTYNGQVTPSAATGGSFTASNYTIAYVAGNITVTAGPTITLSGTLAAVGTTYGTASPTPTSFTVSGGNLTGGLTVTAPAGFEVSTTAGSGYAGSLLLTQTGGTVSSTVIFVRLAATTVAGTYSGNVSVSGGGATSQSLATASSTVAPKALTITGLTGANKVYDRATTASTTGTATLSGVVGSDNVTLSGTPVFSFADALVATGKAITVTGYTLSGTAAANYTVGQPADLAANITQAPLTVTGAAVTPKPYDGTDAATITGTLSGVISPDVVTFSGTGTFATVNVGTGIVVTSTSTIGGADAGNYSLTQPTGLTGNITQATQTITFGALPSKQVGGVPFALTATATSGLAVSYESSNTAVATVTGGSVTILGAGTTNITASQAGDTNFAAAVNVLQTLTVTSASGGTTLAAGDIALIGFNAAGAPDSFTILVLKDLAEGTRFFASDNEVTTDGGTSFADVGEMEASFVVKAGQSIPAGTVIVLPWGGEAVSATTYDWSATPSAGLNNGPSDEIYLYTAATISDLTPTAFVFGARLGTGTGQRPSGLTAGSTWLTFASGVTAARYKTSGATYSASQSNLLTAIGNTAGNWENVAPVAAGDWTFTITPDTGSVDGQGTVVISNGGAAPLGGTTVFRRSQASQTVALAMTGVSSVPITSVEVDVPAAWTGLSAGNVALAGTGFSGASSTVTGGTIRVTGASLTATAPGTIAISGLTTPNPTALTDTGIFTFTTRTAGSGGTLTALLGTQPSVQVTIPILNLSDNDLEGVPLDNGLVVAIEGVATPVSTFTTGSLDSYLQDATDGVAIVRSTGSDVTQGNLYVVKGTVGLAGTTISSATPRGLNRVAPATNADVINLGASTVPAAAVLTVANLLAAPETYEGRLVRINSVQFVPGGTWPTSGTNGSGLVVSDDGGTTSLDVFVDLDTDIDGSVQPSGTFDIVGIFSQFDDVSPYDDGYQILPRSQADLIGGTTGPVTATLAGLTTQPTASIAPGATNVVLAGFTLTATGSTSLTGVTVVMAGTATASDLTNVRIFYDQDGSTTINGPDAAIGTGQSFSASVALTGLTGQTFSGARTFLIVADLPVGATLGRTVTASVASTGLVTTATTNTGSAAGAERTIATAPSIGVGSLFFSEYIEGATGNNKALEIYNGSGVAVDLSDFQIERYVNGASTSSATIALTGTVGIGGVFVVANSGADAAILAVANLQNTNITHNGDDAYILRRISTDAVFDMFGVVGSDPGSAWTDGTVTTRDSTLRRKTSVTAGNPNGLNPITNLSAEWESFPDGTYDGLGVHGSGGPVTATLANLLTQPSSTIAPGANDVVLAGFRLTATGSIDFTAVNVTATGTATSTDLSSVRIFRDENANGVIDGTEASISPTPINFGSTLAFTGLTGQTSWSGTRTYLVVANVAAGATLGNTVTVSVASSGLTTTAVTNSGSATGQARTIAAPVAATLVINEVDYNQDGTDTAEFVELFNKGTSSIDLSTYSLEFINVGGAAYQTFRLTGSVAAGGYYVVGNVAGANLDPTTNTDLIQNGPNDGIVLKNGSTIVDSLGYDGSGSTVAEGTGTTAVDSNTVADVGLSRTPNGTDTDNNNADFALAPITPGAANGSGTADLTIAVAGPSTGTTNVNFSYTITVANIGTASATAVAAEFTVPSGLTYVTSDTNTTGFTSSYDAPSRKVSFAGGTVAASANAAFTVTVTPPTATTYTAAAGAATVDPGNTVTETNESNNASTTAVSTVVSAPGAQSATMAALAPQLSGAIVAGTTNAPLAAFTVTTSGSVDLTGVTVTLAGTATAADLSAFRIFRDVDGNGAVNVADVSVSNSLDYATTLNFTLTNQTIATATASYLIVANVAPGATTARTVTASVGDGAFTTSAGTRSGAAAGVSRTIQGAIAPQITGQPAGATIITGTTATLTVTATGIPAPTFQWYAGGTGDTTTPVSGATAATFVSPALTETTAYWVRASNAGGTADSNTVVVTVVEAPNVNLSALTLSSGTLTPGFLATELSYSASVPGAITSITVTPTTAQAASTVTVNGQPVVSGSSSQAIALNQGNNLISISVFQGALVQTYSVSVFRQSSNADLSALALTGGTLAPSFDPAVPSYSVVLPFTTSSLTVTPTAAGGGAVIRVNGTVTATGTSRVFSSLPIGLTTITVATTSQDGTAANSYQIAVTRRGDSRLSGLSLSEGTLTPAFVAGTLEYTASVPFGISSVIVTPTLSDPNASVTVAGGSASAAVPLSPGSNPIPVVVTATDTTSTTYTVTVTRQTNPALSGLELIGASYTPAFDPVVTEYASTVPSSVTAVSVRLTSADSAATIAVNGSPVLSGAESDPILLAGGSNVITVTSTSSDGLANRVYTLTIQRDAAEIDVRSGSVSLISSVSTFDVGGTLPGRTGTRTLQIVNIGEEPLTGLSVAVSGASQFSASLGGIVAIPSGESIPLSIEFTPSDASAVTAELQILSSDADESPFVIALTGSGDARAAKPVRRPLEPASAVSAVRAPWESGFAGTYDGLLLGQGVSALHGAISNVVITAPLPGAINAPISGVLDFQGRVLSFRGSFRIGGLFESTQTASDGSSVALSLQLWKSAPGGAYLLRGTASLTPPGGSRLLATVDLPQVSYNARTNPAPASAIGRYTMILPSESAWPSTAPGGDGWATVTVNSGGVVAVAGTLGDGVRFTETAYLSKDGEVCLYSNLYASSPQRGRIGGKLVLRDQLVSDFDGRLRWLKFANIREVLYPDGFEVDVWAIGARYAAPARGARMLPGLADQPYNAELSLIGPTAPLATGGTLDRAVSWLTNHRIVHYGSEKLSAVGSATTGLISGAFTDPVSRATVKFTGIALQKQNVAGGLFVRNGASGALRILADTEYPYPGGEDAGPAERVAAAPDLASASETAAAFRAEAAGTYAGILQVGTSTFGGLDNVVLRSTGTMSGTVWINGVRQAFSGQLGSPLVTAAGTVIDLRLALTTGSSDGFRLAGTVSAGSTTYQVDAQRRPAFTSAAPAPQAGAYTVVLRAPDGVDADAVPGGDGYGTVRVSALGACTGSMTLADGTVVTLSGQVGRSDGGVAEWLFHRGLYGRTPRGYVAGKLTFREVAGISDLDGQLHWVKQPGAAPTTVYPGGFDVERLAVGAKYTAPLSGARAIDGLANGDLNVWLRWSGVDLSSSATVTVTEIDRAATWSLANRIVYYGPDRVAVVFNTRTGALSGSMIDATRGINVRFGGVLLQNQDLVGGSYRASGKSGLFSIEPRVAIATP